MITKVLIRNGMTVVISSRKGKVCDEVARLVNSTAAYSVNGGKCVSMPADISTEEGCEKLAQQVGDVSVAASACKEDGRGKTGLRVSVGVCGVSRSIFYCTDGCSHVRPSCQM